MVVSLIGPSDCHLVQRVLMVAAYAGIKLKLVSITEGDENETEAYRLNCHPMHRFPVLKTDEGYLIESNAMIRFLARTEVLLLSSSEEGAKKVPHPQYPVQYALYGHSRAESGEVDSWLDYVSSRLDSNAHPFAHWEKHGGAKPANEIRQRLWAALDGLEKRLVYLKDFRKSIVMQAGGALTARSGRAIVELEDEYVMSEEALGLASARNRRVSTVYNVAGTIRNREEAHSKAEKEKQLDLIRRTTELLDAKDHSRRLSSGMDSSLSPRQSILASARATMALSARASTSTSGGVRIVRQDLFFLVGDSMTAADITVAMALHAIYRIRLLSDAVDAFKECHKFYKAIMMLPVASDMRKAMRISLA